MEILNPDFSFWNGKKVFVTGHTGFKGSWLCMLLSYLKADVYGYALEPPTNPGLFELCKLDHLVHSTLSDIRDAEKLEKAILSSMPDIIIHMAAQPLVRLSYLEPVETFQVNIMGTVNLLEAVRKAGSVRAVVNVTTDKCYENKEWEWPYRENEPLGGYDPYSGSKACSEIVTTVYSNSFFHPAEYAKHRVAPATARAGNVIGGGDWANDRLVPDIMRAIINGEKVLIRNPLAIRPWQHVLEPLTGYLILAEKLYKEGSAFTGAWNFGPDYDDAKNVGWIAEQLCARTNHTAGIEIDKGKQPHEANILKLDCSKAKTHLHWHPRWNIESTLDRISGFISCYQQKGDLLKYCSDEIITYLSYTAR